MPLILMKNSRLVNMIKKIEASKVNNPREFYQEKIDQAKQELENYTTLLKMLDDYEEHHLKFIAQCDDMIELFIDSSIKRFPVGVMFTPYDVYLFMEYDKTIPYKELKSRILRRLKYFIVTKNLKYLGLKRYEHNRYVMLC
jgi:hypothetical protein